MITYVYDDSFEGLMTCIYEAYYRREEPEAIVSKDDLQEDLFSITVPIATDIDKAKRVMTSIESKISPSVLRQIFYVFLSARPDKGMLIYKYLKMGWAMGGNISGHLSENTVRTIHRIWQQVGAERHRMLGLLRFSLLPNNIYYGPMEPDNNILSLIAPHFVRRLGDQNWIIHDLKRGLAAYIIRGNG
ncbi:hypothetical protein N752_03785 [Desulforamulus aquiferis]|nr:TIGR03915 family putative DNA repair protein [Desulforamulus aquiferis]RYD06457.1 hypothetical protein N752_03785 [Desulforamulus aquiferis]